ncbi:unnamed protein product [Macrosiphum euphorbiae]|uniref:Integrase catalytic domain-containing protein n=1 Tax=Macrosiphum euphorbiae TaxID=13131 RepID=A0AAV0W880_9HEMI|nr:unnamed protein product [Macrosiphum euphorbiae]
MGETAEDKEIKRVRRLITRADTKRIIAVKKIRSIDSLAKRAKIDPSLMDELHIAAATLDDLWAQFEAADNDALDSLLEINAESEYSPELPAEVLSIINAITAIAMQGNYDNFKNAKRGLTEQNHASDVPVKPTSRLPEIPLPSFNGDFNYWPTFRDRFFALVGDRTDIPKIDKMQHLIGCLQGAAADAIRNIPVSSDNYDLAWSTLSSRFHRPRLVANALIDKLLNAPVSQQETLFDLNNFVSLFSENIALLNALNIKDLGSFIVFSMAFRCLPASTRKLFESSAPPEFPTVTDLLNFVQSRVSILEIAGDHQKRPNNRPQSTSHSNAFVKKVPFKPTTTSLVVSKPSSSKSDSCPNCRERHTITDCRKFASLSVEDRNKWARDNRVCYTCLSTNHWANKCHSKLRCATCSKKHHTLLHGFSTRRHSESGPSSDDAPFCATSTTHRIDDSSAVLLGTALIHIRDHCGTWQTARAIVDSASQISAITVSCVTRLGLRLTNWTAPITGLSGAAVADVRGMVDCVVQPRFATEPQLKTKAWVMPSITSNMPRRSLDTSVKDRFANLALADPTFNIASSVDMLLGADLFAQIMDGRKVTIAADLPTAFSSIFGWILIGPVLQTEVECHASFPVSLTVSIQDLMEKFWHVEEPVTAPESFTDEGRCEEIFVAEHKRLPSGRFAVPLPTRTALSSLSFPGSREHAIKRFENLEKRLSTDSKLRELYCNFMSEYLALGHMSVAKTPGTYFIPHHAVYRPADGDNKIRVVFDASAKGPQSLSLNECLLKGPKLQQDIVDILTRFRVPKIVFTADICKMYRQILVLPEYRTLQHVFWRSSPLEKLVEYELDTVTYGVNCAPFLALRVLKSIAAEDCDEYISVRKALTHQTYVDDICVGADTEQEALELQLNLITVLRRSGLELKKWSANTLSILNTIPVDSRGSGPLPFDTVDGYSTKILGIEWHPDRDSFCCALRPDPTPVFTKRGILSLVASIYDPLGFFAPSTFLAKSIMQRTWCSGLSWDAPLPDSIHADWAGFVADLASLITIEVPRYINARQGSPCLLLGFCDASQLGYAAVVYVRIIDAPPDNCIFLLGSKTKLAPVKSLTVPRLELNAAVLLARWLGRLNLILAPQLNIIGIHAWSDSMIALSWLNVPHESFKTYVSNRVHQVHTLIPTCQWHHIDSSNNPADCASRGVMPSVLASLTLYWSGPPVIYTDTSGWERTSPQITADGSAELRPVVCTAVVNDVCAEWFSCFSSFDRMIRVIARVRRFIECCRRGRLGVRPPEYLCKSELDEATRVLILVSQRVHFAVLRRELSNSNHISSKSLSKLSPFIGADSVIRVGGRLKHSLLTYDCKHPVLLAKESYFAKLLCERWHRITCHSGPRVMAALISRQYWIIALRSVLHRVMSRCTVCVRLNAQPAQPLMADLPAARVQPCRPFARVGVDFAGPLQMRDLGLRKPRVYKVYIAVFICFTVKAVHLEVVSNLSTDAFLAALDRFVARRGLPSDIYSDCGTNFVGANKQLHQLINSPENQVVIANARPSFEWHFNPPSAPHFGGLWEAAVRSTKRLLVRVIGTHVLTYEEFTTVLTRIEAVLNSRPLTPASTDPRDLECITPGHFLIGQPLIAVPPRSTPDSKRNVRDRWKLLDQCHQAFWRRWSNEYLTTLQERSKWTRNVPNLKVNDMVVIIDSHSSPLMWRLGRVMEVTPGADGIVRVARVLTSTGDITRPVVKLVPLPVD